MLDGHVRPQDWLADLRVMTRPRRPTPTSPSEPSPEDVLQLFHPAVRAWFSASFSEVTQPQRLAFAAIARGDSVLLSAPTGSGKTLAAFLWALDRLMFAPPPPASERCRILYVSPLKALAVDVERNLQVPLAGIAQVAEQLGIDFTRPVPWVRTGDTPARERTRFLRAPADIVITTPESLYLLLTGPARAQLKSVRAVIIDEIHVLCGTKRGTHLALSLERLQALCPQPLQRIGLSATQRPLDEVARYLGGLHRAEPGQNSATVEATQAPQYRPVTILESAARKSPLLLVATPTDSQSEATTQNGPRGPQHPAPLLTGSARSSWTALYPRLLELIRSHNSTLLFVNSRRVAERLANALNELAEQPLVRAHHGSLAAPQRREIEELLKSGQLRGLVATSSLELGIDMGAIDLVLQLEAPPSVAAGLQRIGRANHQVGGQSHGILFPKHRTELLSCAACARAMREGRVEATRYPRNPLDVLAQQLVAAVTVEPTTADELFLLVRSAASFAQLPRATFDGVLDLLSGRYPAGELSDLRPRLTWDRLSGKVSAREGARRIAILGGGTIADRGLFGVFLATPGTAKTSSRVGELDEEMVFESRIGDIFLLGASSWRIEQITHERVLVSPAPGQPGKMPFWRGESAGRPLELGEEIGRMVRELRALPTDEAAAQLVSQHGLDPEAARTLLALLAEQAQAGAVPDDQTLVLERYRDEVGDTRLCVLSALGARVLAPWCLAVCAQIEQQHGYRPESMWTDDGFVLRIPSSRPLPALSLLSLDPDTVEAQLIALLPNTPLFATVFRQACARALLLPRRFPGARSPLWHQRKRAAELMRVALRYPDFPLLLEAHRECLRDIFDVPSLITTLQRLQQQSLRIEVRDTNRPSPLCRSLLLTYLGQFIYEGDAPAAERRAQALAALPSTIDHAQLSALLGDVPLHSLLDKQAVAEIAAQLSALDPRYHIHSIDGLHDLLLRLGDLSDEEIAARTKKEGPSAALLTSELLAASRALRIELAGHSRLIAVEDAAYYRDALAVQLPAWVPTALLQPLEKDAARLSLLRRYARTHGPFTAEQAAARFGLAPAQLAPAIAQLCATGQLSQGEFRAEDAAPALCDTEVLGRLRRRSLTRHREQIEPVPQACLARLLLHVQGVVRPQHGLDGLLDVLQSLQGVPLLASLLESEILPARVADYQPSQLDALLSAGEVVLCGIEPVGERDGRIALFLADQLPALWRKTAANPDHASPLSQQLVQTLQARGALFFSQLHDATGSTSSEDTVAALWQLFFDGVLTNDTFGAVRAFLSQRVHKRDTKPSRAALRPSFHSRRTSVPPAGQGRWVLLPSIPGAAAVDATFSAGRAELLLARYGVVVREVAAQESLPGGFAAVYPALRRMEEAGRCRRGLFVQDLGPTQFALPAAVELLRSLREPPALPETVLLSAVDPANPYGSILPWPSAPEADGVSNSGDPERSLQRSASAYVILCDGACVAYLRPRSGELTVRLPSPAQSLERTSKALCEQLALLGRRLLARSEGTSASLCIEKINERPASQHPLASLLLASSFFATPAGLQLHQRAPIQPQSPSAQEHDYRRFQAVPLLDSPPDPEPPGTGHRPRTKE